MIFTGPTLPMSCEAASLVTSPNSYEAVLTGCSSSPGYYGDADLIYKLIWVGQDLRWIKLQQKLQNARANTVTMMIPESMTKCSPQPKN